MAKKTRKRTTRRSTKRAPRRRNPGPKPVEEKMVEDVKAILDEEVAWTVSSALEGIENGLHFTNENIDSQLENTLKVREAARGEHKRAEQAFKQAEDELFRADSYVCRLGKMKDLLSGV